MSTRNIDKMRVNIGQRLKSVRTLNSLSQQAFAESVDTSSGYISDIETGKNSPGIALLRSLNRVYGIDINWLLTGRREEAESVEPDYTLRQPIKSIKYDKRDKSFKSLFFDAPILGVAGGGAPVENHYREIDDVALHQAILKRHGPGEYFGVWVKGSSMEPVIRSGSLVICKRESPSVKRARKDAIYCLNVPDEAGGTIKKVRYRAKGNVVELIPLNMVEHEPHEYRPGEVKIIGRAVGVAWHEL